MLSMIYYNLNKDEMDQIYIFLAEYFTILPYKDELYVLQICQSTDFGALRYNCEPFDLVIPMNVRKRRMTLHERVLGFTSYLQYFIKIKYT